jgi:tRNA dimethylallyltransferase
MPPTSSPLPVVLILGPTAGGKSDLAISIAHNLHHARLDQTLAAECITADSMQIYRTMDIGTAKPSREQLQQVPHHLFDLVDPSEDGFTVDTWLATALQKIAEIRARNRIPIIVGGTNLYVQAFLSGLMTGPAPDPVLRAKLENITLDELRDWLVRVDPEAAARIHRNDRKRSVRAIEVFELTGKKLSASQTQWLSDEDSPNDSPADAVGNLLIIGLEYPVDVINRRINARVKKMMDDGLLREARELLSHGDEQHQEDVSAGMSKLGRQAREALGYKQIFAHLRGDTTLEEAVEEIKIRTRRFAKQQRNWLKRFRARKDSLWLNVQEGSESELQTIAEQAVRAILERLDLKS